MAVPNNKVLSLAALLCCAIAVVAQPTPAKGSFQALAGEAQRASTENRLTDAVRLYRQGLKLEPSWKEGWWGLGTALYDQSQYRDAMQAFDRLTAIDTKNGSARLFLGLCQFELGADDAALKNIKAARSLGILNDPQLRRVALYDEVQLELKKAAFETALETLKLLMREAIESNEVKLAWGMAMMRMRPANLPPQGSAEREVVLKLGAAQELAAAKKFEEAKQAYQQIVNSAPEFPAIHYAFGRFLLDAHEVDEAVHEFEQEIKNDPRNVMARLQIAAVRYRTDSAAGLPFAEEAVKLEPRFPFGHYLLGLLYLDVGNAAKAIPQLEFAERHFPEESKIYFALGNAYAKVGRKQEATRARQTFVRLNNAHSQQAETRVYGEGASSVEPQ